MILLHAGFPKTGTSSLQVASATPAWSRKFVLRWNGVESLQNLKITKRSALTIANRTGIVWLSGENLFGSAFENYSQLDQNLIALIETIQASDIQVIATIRSPISWCLSIIQESFKHPAMRPGLNEIQSHFLKWDRLPWDDLPGISETLGLNPPVLVWPSEHQSCVELLENLFGISNAYTPRVNVSPCISCLYEQDNGVIRGVQESRPELGPKRTCTHTQHERNETRDRLLPPALRAHLQSLGAVSAERLRISGCRILGSGIELSGGDYGEVGQSSQSDMFPIADQTKMLSSVRAIFDLRIQFRRRRR